ncbi:hypothetical protein Tco_1401989 [Tanacetum coccineum]
MPITSAEDKAQRRLEVKARKLLMDGPLRIPINKIVSKLGYGGGHERQVGERRALIQKLHQKRVYEESFSRHAAWIKGKLIQLMHTTMVPKQVSTMKIQAGVQVSRPGELRRHLQL